MDIKKALRKPSNLINIGLAVFLVIYSRVATGAPFILFEIAVWVSLGYAIQKVVTPWIMEGFGLEDPVEEPVDQ
jgi:hypothetical protein